MTKRFIILIPILIVLTIAGCGRQYHAAPGGERFDPSSCGFLRGTPEFVEFKGAGEVTVLHGRQKQSAKIDVRAQSGGYFRTQIHSPFGNIVAEAEAKDFKGHFKLGGERFDFSYDDVMDIPLLPVSPRFTYREFIKTLSGTTPEFMRKLPPEPDTIFYTRRDAVALWSSDSLAVWMRISRKTGAPVSATFDYGGVYGKMSRFDKSGAPRDVMIKDLDGNYINVKYDVVRVVR